MSAYSNENCGSEDKQGRDKNERTILVLKKAQQFLFVNQ
jgi:hypothetical protein